ncbi:MAG: transketolase [Acidobacteriota bacterium]
MTTTAGPLDIEALLGEPDRSRKAAQLQYLAQFFRLTVFDILHEKGTGHWGGASSAAELLVSLYFHAMNVRPEDPRWMDRDRLVLSKGHASCMLYTVLAYRGFFPVEELATFRQLDSRLQGHPCMYLTPGVDMSTGALGHGLSVALGMALAARLRKKSFCSYVLLGEGDLDEGQTWEAVMAAAKFRPERLVALIDYNKVQLDGPSQHIMPLDPLPEKLRAFNWNVAPDSCAGHSIPAILDSFDWISRQTRWPVAVIYATCKGRGVSFMENNAYWHGSPIDEGSYARGRPELLKTLEELEAKL